MRGRFVVLLSILASSGPLWAQDVRVGLAGGYFDFTAAKNSTKAVFGSSGGVTFGADVDVGVSDHYYVGVAGRYFRKDGQRVFIASATSPVFPLMNEPLSAHLIPLEATVGYRFGTEQSSIRPYAGIGPGLTVYHEESTVGGQKSSLDETKFAFHAAAGLEFGQGQFRAGVELRYSIVPNALGVGGVSQVYNEKDIGGITILGRIVFATSRR